MVVTLFDLLDEVQYYPVYKALCASFDVVSIVRLSMTCKKLNVLLKQLWDVDQLLRRFVADPKRLRRNMRLYGAVISGGLALQFFDRQTWMESDMDLFVRGVGDAEAFGRYFRVQEGYGEVDISENGVELMGYPLFFTEVSVVGVLCLAYC
jgi:hypothetical protein